MNCFNLLNVSSRWVYKVWEKSWALINYILLHFSTESEVPYFKFNGLRAAVRYTSCFFYIIWLPFNCHNLVIYLRTSEFNWLVISRDHFIHKWIISWNSWRIQYWYHLLDKFLSGFFPEQYHYRLAINLSRSHSQTDCIEALEYYLMMSAFLKNYPDARNFLLENCSC